MSFLVRFSDQRLRDCASQAVFVSEKAKRIGEGGLVTFLPEVAGKGTLQAHLNGRLWLIGRIRLDGREDLCSALAPLDKGAFNSDADLCLHAYAKWGEHCAKYLKGDFCFVLWDEHRQLLFCARDHFGVRPLFYIRTAKEWLLSDSLQSIALHTNLISELDNYWIGDFLTIGYPLDTDRTVYKNVKRLPPAHFFLISRQRCHVQRYWTLEVTQPIYYRNSGDYSLCFRELVSKAIKDRLPPARVGIAMSGGLDSSTLAALTVNVVGDHSKVVAHTCYFDYLIPDEERRFSERVADKLGIKLIARAVDQDFYDPEWSRRSLQTAEPTSTIARAFPQAVIDSERFELSPVWFFGEGPDNALQFEWRAYLRWLLEKRLWRRLGEATVQYILSKKAREWYATVRKVAPNRQVEADNHTFEWLADTLVKEVNFVDRLRDWQQSRVGKHPWHPRAIASFESALWPNFLELFDPAIANTRVEWRHPFLDLRVLQFLLSVPPIPWARRKRLMREAMQNVLPDEVVDRDKTPLARDPEAILLQQHPLPRLSQNALAAPWVNTTNEHMLHGYLRLRIHALEFWLRSHNAGGI